MADINALIKESEQARKALAEALNNLAQKYAALSETPGEYTLAEDVIKRANAAVNSETGKPIYSLKGLGQYTNVEQLAAAYDGSALERTALGKLHVFKLRKELLEFSTSPELKAAQTADAEWQLARVSGKARTVDEIIKATSDNILKLTPYESQLRRVAENSGLDVATGKIEAGLHPHKMVAAELEAGSYVRLLNKGSIPATIAFELMYSLAAYQSGLQQQDIDTAARNIIIENYARQHGTTLDNVPQEQTIEQNSR